MRIRSVALASALACASCSPHPIGPARTFADYEAKARTTAESARSGVETALLVISADRDDHATSAYTASLLSEQEDGLSSVAGTFESIQPPDARGDQVRDQLVELLDAGAGHVADARIIARRGSGPDLEDLVDDLEADADALGEFLAEHGG